MVRTRTKKVKQEQAKLARNALKVVMNHQIQKFANTRDFGTRKTVAQLSTVGKEFDGGEYFKRHSAMQNNRIFETTMKKLYTRPMRHTRHLDQRERLPVAERSRLIKKAVRAVKRGGHVHPNSVMSYETHSSLLLELLSKPVLMAADIEQFHVLIDRKADVNSVDKYGHSALSYAVEHNNLDIVKALIRAGAKIPLLDRHRVRNPPGIPNGEVSLLMYAIRGNRNVDIVKALLETRPGTSYINYKNQHGQTALLYAVFSQNPALVELLLNAGAAPSVDVKTIGSGMTPLMYAVTGRIGDHFEKFGISNLKIVEILLRAGANPLLRNAERQTARDLLGDRTTLSPMRKKIYDVLYAAEKAMKPALRSTRKI
jgi:hypothetical protein